MITHVHGARRPRPDRCGNGARTVLDHKEPHVAEATLRNQRYRLGHFVRWCEETGLDNLNDLRGRSIHEFRLWRKEDGDPSTITLSANMSTLRVFLEWAATIEAVPTALHEKVLVPRVDPEDQHKSVMLEADTAEAILDYLSTYHFASLKHVLIGLLWETGIRMGSAIAIDLDDVDLENRSIAIRHRPDQDTPLKNGSKGERPVALSKELAEVIGDYIEHSRHDSVDEFGREALLTTSVGRVATANFRRIVYEATAPCFRGEPCEACEPDSDRKCGEAVSPPAIRRGSITHHLVNHVPVEVVGDRMNVSRKVLDKHYDQRSEEVKLEQRRGYLEDF